jgi:hypothetical protein
MWRSILLVLFLAGCAIDPLAWPIDGDNDGVTVATEFSAWDDAQRVADAYCGLHNRHAEYVNRVTSNSSVAVQHFLYYRCLS